MYPNLLVVATTMLKGKWIVLKDCIRKKESEKNDLSFYLKKLEQ